ncbi:MAG: adenylate kinase [Bacteroidia bacterium]|nr:MAG: adenylate kinase [Bacteroidia bacterium]
MQVLLLMGPPGAGKGTQARRLVEDYGWAYLATGDLLRQEIQAGTPLGKNIQALVEGGKLIPDQLIVSLVEQQLQEGRTYLLDGFPRTVGQAEALEALLRRKNARLLGALFLEVPEDTLLARIQGRAQVEHRADDSLDTFRIRLEEYHQKTRPLAAWYEERGLLRRINGVGSIEEVHHRLKEAIGELLKQA